MRFLRELHQKFEGRRQQLLAKRHALQLKIDAGQYMPDFDSETKNLREDGSWHGSTIPKDMLVSTHDIIHTIHSSYNSIRLMKYCSECYKLIHQ